eukprot:TRINITY_DN3240_c3_g1_i2.p1 TRINITY_DN3240_c3_g1~~TRINITY_DN3240_c3_g1_i2.p1  ORF type:complete len:497 (+),score=87.55 TRINITY_DN3240_c3_g1_i2:811-2301(+)
MANDSDALSLLLLSASHVKSASNLDQISPTVPAQADGTRPPLDRPQPPASPILSPAASITSAQRVPSVQADAKPSPAIVHQSHPQQQQQQQQPVYQQPPSSSPPLHSAASQQQYYGYMQASAEVTGQPAQNYAPVQQQGGYTQAPPQQQYPNNMRYAPYQKNVGPSNPHSQSPHAFNTMMPHQPGAANVGSSPAPSGQWNPQQQHAVDHIEPPRSMNQNRRFSLPAHQLHGPYPVTQGTSPYAMPPSASPRRGTVSAPMPAGIQHQSQLQQPALPRKPFPCDQCHKSFDTRAQQRRHIKNVHSEKRFHCTHCSKSFANRQQVVLHTDTVHRNKKAFACEICGKCFGHKHHVTTHVKTVHLKVKNFQCPHCMYKSGQQGHLTMHINTVHLKRAAHVCEDCPAEFTRRERLRKHMLSVHNKQPSAKSTAKKPTQPPPQASTPHLNAVQAPVYQRPIPVQPVHGVHPVQQQQQQQQQQAQYQPQQHAQGPHPQMVYHRQ